MALLVSLAASCDSAAQQTGPSEIHRRSPRQLADRPGETIGPIVVQVLGPPIQGVPGRNGFRDPVEGVDVTFSFKSLPSNDDDSDVEVDTEKDGDGSETGSEGTESQPAKVEQKNGGEQNHGVGDPTLSKKTTLSAPVSHPRFVDAAFGTPIPGDGLEATVTTDEQGLARISVKLGMFVGDFRVHALIRNAIQQRRSVDFLVISGLRIIDDRSEGIPGASLPVTLRLWRVVKADAEASPEPSAPSAAGEIDDGGDEDDEDDDDGVVEESGWRAIPDAKELFVYSVVEGEADGATLEKQRDRTSNRGFSTIRLKLGEKSGRYRVLAEVAPKKKAPIHRGILIEHYAINWWQFGLSFVGGVALFVVGLRVLASGLTIQFGQPLNGLAGAMTKNRFYGLIGGVGAGAAFSSSSAVASHLVSFANGGLLAAAEASGQVLGANLGKTVLFQLMAFSSIAALAVPLIATATLLHLLPNRLLTLRPWANMLLGGGLVLLGWQFLGESADLGALSPGFRNVLAAWDPALDDDRVPFASLVVFCAVVTASTVASFLLRGANPVIAVAVAFVTGGMMSFTMIIAVITGAGIGSALSTFVTSLRRNRQARRLAFSQVLYQVGGGAWLFVATMIPVGVGGTPLIVRITDLLTPGLLFHTQPENVTHHVAVLYTLVHLINAVVFLSLNPWIQKVVVRVLPRDPVSDDIKPYRLDPAMVNVPSLALAQATREVFYLGELVRKAVAEAFDAFRYLDLNLTAQVARREESASSIQQSVLQHLLRVSENELSRSEAVRLQTLHAAAGGFNQISEIGDQLSHVTSRIVEEKLEVPEDLLRELTEIDELMMNQIENVLHLLENYDRRVEENALKVSERVAKASSRLEALWFQRLRQPEGGSGVTHAKPGSVVVVLLTRQAFDALVQVTGHLTNIVELLRILTARK